MVLILCHVISATCQTHLSKIMNLLSNVTVFHNSNKIGIGSFSGDVSVLLCRSICDTLKTTYIWVNMVALLLNWTTPTASAGRDSYCTYSHALTFKRLRSPLGFIYLFSRFQSGEEGVGCHLKYTSFLPSIAQLHPNIHVLSHVDSAFFSKLSLFSFFSTLHVVLTSRWVSPA